MNLREYKEAVTQVENFKRMEPLTKEQVRTLKRLVREIYDFEVENKIR